MDKDQLTPVQYFMQRYQQVRDNEKRLGITGRKIGGAVPRTTLENAVLELPTKFDVLTLRAGIERRCVILHYPFGFPIAIRKALGVVNPISLTIDEIKMLIDEAADKIEEYSMGIIVAKRHPY